jgi:hypothetical protein
MNEFITSEVGTFLAETHTNVNKSSDFQLQSLFFDFGGHTIRVAFVGIKDTKFFTDAIVHRLVDEPFEAEELSIYVVDDSVAASVLPEPFWSATDFDYYGRFQGSSEDDFVEYLSNGQVLIVLNRQIRICLVWVRDVANLPEWERSFPFRTVLYQWFKGSRYLFVHAGAVGNESGGVLLTGKGGMGKSTATLSCLDSELKYAGDDFVMIDTESLIVHSLYNVAKLEASNLHRFPELVPHIANPEAMPADKGQLFLHFFKPECLILDFKLKAIFLPKFSGKEHTTIRKATKGEALLALAPSTIGLLKAESDMLSRISAFIQTLPCYWIETGTNLPEIPSTLANWLKTESYD